MLRKRNGKKRKTLITLLCVLVACGVAAGIVGIVYAALQGDLGHAIVVKADATLNGAEAGWADTPLTRQEAESLPGRLAGAKFRVYDKNQNNIYMFKPGGQPGHYELSTSVPVPTFDPENPAFQLFMQTIGVVYELEPDASGILYLNRLHPPDESVSNPPEYYVYEAEAPEDYALHTQPKQIIPTVSIPSALHTPPSPIEEPQCYVLYDEPKNMPVFTNIYTEYGSLDLTKEVTGGGDANKLFTFTVTFSGQGMDFSGVMLNGKLFPNGGTVELKHGQTAHFSEIPDGATYTIVENDYSADGYNSDKPDNTVTRVVTAGTAVTQGAASLPTADVSACGASDSYSLGSSNSGDEHQAKIGFPGDLEQFAAAKLKNNTSSVTYYGKCLNAPRSAGWNNTYDTTGPQNGKIAFVAALTCVEQSGLTDAEFNLLFGFDGMNGHYDGAIGYDYGITHFTAAQQRHALTQCLVWYYVGLLPGNSAHDWTHTPTGAQSIAVRLGMAEMNGMNETQWNAFVAAADELYDKFFTAQTPEPSFNAAYTQTGAESALLKFANLTNSLSYTSQKVIVEWTTPGVTVTHGSAPVASGDIIAITNGLILDITMPAGTVPVITLTDALRYPIAETLHSRRLECEEFQPLIIASCAFGKPWIKTFDAALSGSVAFTNSFDASTPFSFTKTNRAGMAFGLNDAQFKLYEFTCTQEHAHDTLAPGTQSCWTLLLTKSTDAAGLVDFGELSDGLYLLAETKTASQYQLPTGQWLLTVDHAATPKIAITTRGKTPPAFKAGQDGL